MPCWTHRVWLTWWVQKRAWWPIGRGKLICSDRACSQMSWPTPSAAHETDGSIPLSGDKLSFSGNLISNFAQFHNNSHRFSLCEGSNHDARAPRLHLMARCLEETAGTIFVDLHLHDEAMLIFIVACYFWNREQRKWDQTLISMLCFKH